MTVKLDQADLSRRLEAARKLVVQEAKAIELYSCPQCPFHERGDSLRQAIALIDQVARELAGEEQPD